MPNKQVLCYYCGRPSIRLCDGIIARKADLMPSTPVEFESVLVYCFRPLCLDCIAESTRIFFDGTTAGGGKRRGWQDTVDYCPQCVKEGRNQLGVWRMAPVVSEERAQQLQASRLSG